MKSSSLFAFALLLAVACISGFAASAQAQLRIVDYNCSGVHSLNGNSSQTASLTPLMTIVQAIAAENVNGVTRPVDVFSLQEINVTTASDIQTITDKLNSVYKDANGVGIYAHSVLTGHSSSGTDTTQMIIYNTKTVQLVGEKEIGASDLGGGSTQIPRTPIRYELRPVGYAADGSNDFYLYNSHYKASADSPNTTRRQQEAKDIRIDADTLGAGARIIYAGDYNIYHSTEPMWGELTTSTAANGHNATSQAFDPLHTVDGLNSIGDWTNNSAFKLFDTQSPSDVSQYSGQVTGGMDDRFDFQLITSALTGSTGMAYMPGSYHAFGNNGTHTFNGAITTGTGAAPAVLTALTQASDHLPDVAQYQLPAKMGMALATVPAQVFVSTPLSAQVTVNNSAGDGVVVTTANGADKLSYTASATGAASGTASGSGLLAFGTGKTDTYTLSTATAGNKSGSITVTATSAQTPNAVQSTSISYAVYDHANGSFASDSDVNTLTVNIGSFFLNSGLHQSALSLSNLVSTLNFTDGLKFVSVPGTGDTNSLSTDLQSFANLAAGSSVSFNAKFNATTVGSYAATYTLNLADASSYLGASTQQLTLNLQGTVTYRPGDFNLDGQLTSTDADLMLHALVDLPDYQAMEQLSPTDLQTVTDVNGDHAFDNGDIQSLLNMIVSGSNASSLSVPEPSSLALFTVGALLLLRKRRQTDRRS